MIGIMKMDKSKLVELAIGHASIVMIRALVLMMNAQNVIQKIIEL